MSDWWGRVKMLRLMRKVLPEARPAPGRLVLVEWEDSAQPVGSWQWLDDYAPTGIVSVQSVGWIISEGEFYALAPNIGGAGGVFEQVSGVIQIPSRCVISVRDISA